MACIRWHVFIQIFGIQSLFAQLAVLVHKAGLDWAILFIRTMHNSQVPRFESIEVQTKAKLYIFSHFWLFF